MLITNSAIIVALDGVELDTQSILLCIAHKKREVTYASLVTDHLTVLLEEELIYRSDDLWGLTWKGKERLKKMTGKLPKTSVAGKGYHPAPTGYTGDELKATCLRPGAYDFLLCKSMVNGALVPYRTAHLHEGAMKV